MSKSNFARNLATLRDGKRLSQQRFGEAIGMSRATIWNWENDKTIPSREYIQRLCDFFEVTEADLFGKDEGAYAKATGLNRPVEGAASPAAPKPAYAPLYGRVHAGDAEEPIVLDGHIPIPYEVWENHQAGYFLEVEGDCMSRVYPPGCFVFVDPERQPQDGSIAVVSIDGSDYIMRRLKMGNSMLMLVAESYSTEWDDLVFRLGDDHDVSLVGTVVWYQPADELE